MADLCAPTRGESQSSQPAGALQCPSVGRGEPQVDVPPTADHVGLVTDHDDPAELVRETTECKLQFHERYWRNVSDLAKEFIQALVVPDPIKRLGAEDALNHPVRITSPL